MPYNHVYFITKLTCITGFPTSYGIFQAYYSSLPSFAFDETRISIIGTMAQGLYYLGAPLSAALAKRFPRWQQAQILLGWLLCIFSLLTASFANSVGGLIATQGIMYGLGFLILTYPIINMVSEWWIARKGMAFGLISAASGMTGVVMPLILDSLLQRYGYRTTLRACAIAMFILTAPLIPALKGRLPASESAQVPKADLSFFRKPLFWTYGCATTVKGLGFFIPSIFVPSYANAIDLPTKQGALLLTLMATSQTLGQSAFGWLSDKMISVSMLSSSCCIVAAVATATLWGLAKALPPLAVYSIVYVFFAYGFGTMRVAMGRAVSDEQSAVVATYSSFVFLQGIGNVMVGPITSALLSGAPDIAKYGAQQYGEVVVFVGATSMLAGLIILVPSASRLLQRWTTELRY
jgi:MFS family permease